LFEEINAPLVALVAGAGTISALVDLRTRRLPNPLTLGIAVTGLALAAARWSGVSVTSALLGLAAGTLLMLPAYVFGAMGGGDVKLFAATGTLLGPQLTLIAFVYTLIAGGLFAVVVALNRRRLSDTFRNAAALVRSGGAAAAAIEHPSVNNRFAYAPAIAVGTVAAALGL
jgi:prepilin peptidase CpaA